jgi:hypothetical protein
VANIALEVQDDQTVAQPQDFLTMLNNPDSFPDITLIFDGTSLHCHRVILASRSLYFEALFSHDFKETE